MQREYDKLKAENEELREDNKRLEDLAFKGKDAPGGGLGVFKLPTEEELDSALNHVEKLFKKFRDKLRDLGEDEDKGIPL